MDRKRKRELRDINLMVWEGAHDIFPVAASLDSSLKKNTAFIKRLRTGILPSAQAGLIAEIQTLSLQKYLSEVVSAAAEGVSRLKTVSDIGAGVEVLSALHQRFGPSQFTKQLGWLLGRGLTSPDKSQVRQWTQEVREREEKERIIRHRTLLRIVTELWLCGVLRSLDDTEKPSDSNNAAKDIVTSEPSKTSKGQEMRNILAGIRNDNMRDNDPFPLEVLKDLLGHDPDLVNLPLALLFVKYFAWDVLGVKPASEETKRHVETNGEVVGEHRSDGLAAEDYDTPLIPAQIRERFFAVIKRYNDFVTKRIINDQQALSTQSKRNTEAYVRSGEIFEDRQTNFEKAQKMQEKLVASAQTLCEVLGQEMPNLAVVEESDFVPAGTVGIVKAGELLRGTGDGPGIWEDEDERRFYEKLIDLKGRVPGILLEDGKKTRTDDEAAHKQSRDTPKLAESDDASMQIANRTVGAQVDALLARLPDLQTKDQVDSIAHDFCFLNSKASRNRLIKNLQEVPKGRTDLLPLYSRLVATLGQYMADIVNGIVSYLDDEFRSLQRRKTKDFLGQVRLFNIRYLAELTKFGVVPEHVIFHCFKVSLDDFSRMNIEIIASLLENCGRFLLRNQDTAPRMASFLETLSRKKSVAHLGQQERMLIENALYYVDPPERAAIEQKERTPTELFIRQLIYVDMTKRNYMKVLKTIRKLHWEEIEVVNLLEKIFSKPQKVKFSSIHLLAVLLGALSRYHQNFATTIIDNVLENVQLGLENNDFKFNQKRIAEVKYLGELYNYKMIDSSIIFDTLYRIVTFGHPNGTPAPGQYTHFDQSDDFFRIRLVCAILETCGICFDRGSSRKKLDFFLTFFQYYALTKDPLPLEVDFTMQDTYALVRPSWKLVTDLSEAARLFADAVKTKYQQEDDTMPSHEPEDVDESESDDEILDEDGAVNAEVNDLSGDEGAEDINDDEASAHVDPVGSEDEHIVVVRQEEEIDPEAEAEFDAAFASMMFESVDARKNERQARFDMPLPVRKVQRTARADFDNGESTDEEPPAPVNVNTVAFQLMTKKGNKQQTRTIDLPSDSAFALSFQSQQVAEREEQQRIKNLVLNSELLGEDDQHDGQQYYLDSSGRPPRQRAQKARKLDLRDVDWYGKQKQAPDSRAALDDNMKSG